MADVGEVDVGEDSTLPNEYLTYNIQVNHVST
jgi:hypothetical protein